MTSEIYVPTEIVYSGVTYQEGWQEVPNGLANVIISHPVWSKAKAPKQVDKFAHLRNQSLAYLKGQLANFEADLAKRHKQIQVHLAMGSVPPKQLLVAQKVALADFRELQSYLEPLIKTKEAQEAARRSRVVAVAAARGAKVVFDQDGNWSESYDRQTVQIGGIK